MSVPSRIKDTLSRLDTQVAAVARAQGLLATAAEHYAKAAAALSYAQTALDILVTADSRLYQIDACTTWAMRS